jgi:hypothetical protein
MLPLCFLIQVEKHNVDYSFSLNPSKIQVNVLARMPYTMDDKTIKKKVPMVIIIKNKIR